jgi:hypothetical protein
VSLLMVAGASDTTPPGLWLQQARLILSHENTQTQDVGNSRSLLLLP